MRVHEFDQALAVRDPITLRFPDGRVFDFPGDINAGAYLAFQREYGARIKGVVMPPDVVIPFYDLVFGELLGKLETELELVELRWAAGTLWSEYMGIIARAPDDQTEEPETTRPT